MRRAGARASDDSADRRLRRVPTCPSCGKELPGEFPFCPFCGAPLTAEPAAPVQEERKIVTVLFCDLVGFTAASEAADPEDVRARIRPYHARLRQEIERYGGTVEKFIGDAVMAVFGAPTAHEDDAERAVRAGLRILEAIEELNEAGSDARAAGAHRHRHRRGGRRAWAPALKRARASSRATSSTPPPACRGPRRWTGSRSRSRRTARPSASSTTRSSSPCR